MKTTSEALPDHRGPDNEHPLMTLVRGWDWFWFYPADPTTLGLMRISAGLLVVYIHLAYCLGLMGYLGKESWVGNDPANPQTDVIG
jgi:hypothetical protein